MLVEPWLARAAAAHPSRTAVETPNGSLSYAELERASGAAAAALAVAPGDCVAVALQPGGDFAVALHACLRSGATAVPIDPRLPAAEQERIASGCVRVVDEPLTREGRELPWRAQDLDAAAVRLHTSGTSGRPKPVDLTLGNFLWNALGSAVALGLDPAERWLCTLPLAHVGGLSILMRSAVYATTVILHERFDTEAALTAIDEATLVSLVPTTLARLLDGGLARPRALRCVLLGGAPTPTTLIERAALAGVVVSRTYGLTEACSQVSTQLPGDRGDDSGPPLFCTRVEIADDGEILVSGPTVAGGGTLRTGDLGEWGERGGLRVVGRKSELIVSGGENIAPAEVEDALLSHPAVVEAGVVGVPHPEWGEAVRAVVVLGTPASEDELREHCAARLARFKVPKELVVADGPLPRTPSGKLLRRELR